MCVLQAGERIKIGWPAPVDADRTAAILFREATHLAHIPLPRVRLG
jgi:hypothetical protein